MALLRTPGLDKMENFKNQFQSLEVQTYTLHSFLKFVFLR